MSAILLYTLILRTNNEQALTQRTTGEKPIMHDARREYCIISYCLTSILHVCSLSFIRKLQERNNRSNEQLI